MASREYKKEFGNIFLFLHAYVLIAIFVLLYCFQWLVGNIPGTDVAKGETLSEYVGSGPPEGTGKLGRSVDILAIERRS